MPKLLTCPQGHQWEINDQGNALTTDVRVLCPTCGAVVDLVTPDSAEEPATRTVVPPPGPMPPVEPVAARLTSVPAPAAPPAVPGYEILAELGRGGMGVVYTARQVKLDRLVAVKVLPPERGNDPASTERFRREARALAKLHHPNIVTVHDFGQTTGHAFFIMEYVEGVNLRQRLRPGPMTPHEALQIVVQICDALQYAHDEGIIHRDIKPENILLDKNDRVKIADFGLAKLLVRQTADYTLTGPMQVMGTLKYMAPEQLENPLTVDHRADIYSLGVVFYETMTGELPLGRFAPPSQKVPVDARWDDVVLRALEKEPQRRYQRVSDFRTAIQSLRKEPVLPMHAESETGTAIDASRRGLPLPPTASLLSTGKSPRLERPGHGQGDAVVRGGGWLGAVFGGIVGVISGVIYGIGVRGAGGFWLSFGLFGAIVGLVVGRNVAGFYVGYVRAKKSNQPRKPHGSGKGQPGVTGLQVAGDARHLVGRTHKLLDVTDTLHRLLQLGIIPGGILVVVGMFFILAFRPVPGHQLPDDVPQADFPGAVVGGISCLMLGISLAVFGSVIKQRWQVKYKGHRIRFENGVFTGEKLFIDDGLVSQGGIGSRMELTAAIHDGEGIGDQIVAVAEAGLFSFRCRVMAEEAG